MRSITLNYLCLEILSIKVTLSNDEIISHIFSSSRSVDKPRSCRKSTKESLFKLSLAERSEVVLLANGRSRKEVVEEFNRRHPNRPPISSNCVKRLLTKLKETGSVHDRPRSGRPRKATTGGSSCHSTREFATQS
ncbi:hypothetical protein OESDEN_12007 [Oesophagostomum dentatum]|uniref:Uncharacterized protein n=1 Tax=Oesophagostomum dentatum TaxID=61180 RepID=A0A0B1SSE2_OESDE|nr:hypothetical protein OESDEN_12007 [Oesophagostomum dentatum]